MIYIDSGGHVADKPVTIAEINAWQGSGQKFDFIAESPADNATTIPVSKVGKNSSIFIISTAQVYMATSTGWVELGG